ncbi:hypothetical protein F0562_014283 [Nyssa sinensis]|uniref:Protein kinase domain-containing protein n=1 Tax=Nyssa sinensis TaxID=561372 RepID=A0A5J4ZMG1_9ASTE|nr:hypothetical protein F0562_014283 [Nyssa sinensis]
MSFFACCKVERSKSMKKKNQLISSKSCLNEYERKINKKCNDDEALATFARSISMQSGSLKQTKLVEEIRKFGNVKTAAEVVAVKQLDRNGLQGNREFLAEVLTLSLVHHPNLVNLIGYCADGRQRILVYEYMPNGSLEDHLLDLPAYEKPLDWKTRMKIAKGAAEGLEYLHDTASPPIIYR